MNKIYIFFALVFILFESCVTARVAHLTPQLDNRYVSPEGMTTMSTDSLQVTYGFVYSTPDHLVFDVEVVNKTGRPIEIAPDRFYYQTRGLKDTTLWFQPNYALSDSGVLKFMDAKIKQKKRERTTLAVLTVVGVVASVVIEAKTIDKNNRKDRTERNFYVAQNHSIFRDAITRNFFFEMGTHSDDIEYLKALRADLKGTLLPTALTADTIPQRGTVYFPRNDEAEMLRFHIKVDGNDFQTDYKQKIEVRF